MSYTPIKREVELHKSNYNSGTNARVYRMIFLSVMPYMCGKQK